MRIHTFEATGGKTYSQMGRFLTKDGKDTNDSKLAATDPKTGQPVENGARNLWVTETALTNALNTSFFAEQVALFGIVVGAALLLAGFGFGILAFMAFRWLPAREEKIAKAPTTAPARRLGPGCLRRERAGISAGPLRLDHSFSRGRAPRPPLKASGREGASSVRR